MPFQIEESKRLCTEKRSLKIINFPILAAENAIKRKENRRSLHSHFLGEFKDKVSKTKLLHLQNAKKIAINNGIRITSCITIICAQLIKSSKSQPL